MTETVQWVIKGVYIAMAVALAISNIVSFFKTGKWKKMFKKENAKLSTLDVLMQFMQEVEQFKDFSSEEKKQYVITKFNQFCIDNGYEFIADLTDENVEKLIEFSKVVNSDGRTNQKHTLCRIDNCFA